MGYGIPLMPRVGVRAGGYDDLAGAALVIVTAGVNEAAGGATDRADPAGRLRLLDRNADIYRDLIPQLVSAAPEATSWWSPTRRTAGRPDPGPRRPRSGVLHRHRAGQPAVPGSSGRSTGVCAADVQAFVVGEHGTSSEIRYANINFIEGEERPIPSQARQAHHRRAGHRSAGVHAPRDRPGDIDPVRSTPSRPTPRSDRPVRPRRGGGCTVHAPVRARARPSRSQPSICGRHARADLVDPNRGVGGGRQVPAA